MAEFLAPLLAIMHGLAAGSITVHVLLNHREVRSAIGWIGLVWLSPFVGSSIYLAFGINRTQRRGTQISLGLNEYTASNKDEQVLEPGHPENIAVLARAARSIARLPLARGSSLKLLRDGDAAYPAMLEAINKAETSIALASYILASDDTGDRFAKALIDAKQRGVDIRVLMDGIGSGYFRSRIFDQLSAADIKVARFLHEWLPWQMPFINLRNHKKLLIIDGTIGFTGGMNISDDNVSGPDPIRVCDTHARLEGPIVSHLMATFARDWAFTTGETLKGDAWLPQLAPKGPVAMRGVTSGPDESVGRIEALWSLAIEQAERNVRILTPYFLPEDRLLELLRRAALRGVKIEIVVPEHTNHFYFNWAMRAHMEVIPLDMIDCYLAPDPFDHSKLMSVDGQWSAIGSPNWDARSMRLNFEFLVECYDSEATRAIDELIDSKMANARQLTASMLKSRPLAVRLRDASARLFLPYL